MRKQMPGFYAKNVAKNAQREYLKTGKTRAERMDEARGAVAEILMTAIRGAAMELGINDSERMQRMYVLANMKGAEYSNKKIPTSRDTKGALAAVRRAEMWITEYTKDILPQGFNLPESGSSKKNKEIEILNAQKAAAKNIARFYAAGMHEGLGWDADMIQKAMSIAAKYYTEFQEQARAGDYAAYKLVRENAGCLLFGEEYDSTQEALPDFACTIW